MKHFTFIIICLAFGLSACVDDFEPSYPERLGSTGLRFSLDTLTFDTVFTSVGSITKRFRVYNEHKEEVNIRRVFLGEGADSPYDIIVNGRQGNDLEDIRLLGEDSLLVLVTVNIDPQEKDLPFLVKDFIRFVVDDKSDRVDLVSWGQDAVFITDRLLPCNSRWTANKPYVITTDTLIVQPPCRLIVDAGAKVYFAPSSTLLVAGSIEVNGTKENRVLFQNDRLDEGFINALGQWNGINFAIGSKNSRIEYADIRNAVNGVQVGDPDNDTEPDVIIGNTRIENMSNVGILAFRSDLYVYNTLVNNCAVNAVANLIGGNYTYEHCTFASFSFDFFREEPTMVLSDNIVLRDNSLLADDLNVAISNSIIYGSLEEELVLSSSEGVDFNLSLSNSLLRTQGPGFDINGNLINVDPQFVDAEEYNYQLSKDSPLKDQGGLFLDISTDLNGNDRDTSPDIGAFEVIEE